MMKRNYLWMLLASMTFVGCSQNDDLPEGNENQDKEISYIAINVNATPSVGGRVATEGGFAEGSKAENKVETACFFFFDASGNPFNVNGYVPTNNTVTPDNDAGAGGINWVKYSLTGDEGEDGANGITNVERILNPILILETKKDVYPASVVAVLNWEPDNSQSINLETLRKAVLDGFKNTSGNFIMSNSVYLEGSTPVYCTPLSAQNFADNETLAEEYPIDIYVERVAAKANVTAKYAEDANSFPVYPDATATEQLSITIDNGATPTPVYATIDSWIFNVNNTRSYLMKDLTDLSETTGFKWNDANNFRSYWANAYAFDGGEAWNATTRIYDNTFKWDDMKTAGTADYCLENTDATNYTQVIVKGTLVDNAGNALNIAQWYGKYYTCNSNDNKLLEAVADVVKDRIYTNSSTLTPITASQIKYVWAYDKNETMSADHERDLYTIEFALADGVTVCKPDGTAFAEGDVEEIFASLSPAKYWNNGTVYYYLPIEHYLSSTAGNKVVIRNHYYDIQATKVVGLGTPVPEPDDDDPIPPVRPEEWETYIAAKINVLSWKLITNEVTLQ